MSGMIKNPYVKKLELQLRRTPSARCRWAAPLDGRQRQRPELGWRRLSKGQTHQRSAGNPVEGTQLRACFIRQHQCWCYTPWSCWHNSVLNRTRGSRPGNTHTARQLQRDLYLRVDGEEFSLAEVVRAVVDVLVVVVVDKRHVVVLIVQGTGDVKLLVDYLTTQSQCGSSTFAQPETRCAFFCVFCHDFGGSPRWGRTPCRWGRNCWCSPGSLQGREW